MFVDVPIAETDSFVPPIFSDSIIIATHLNKPLKPTTKPIGARPYDAMVDLGIIDTDTQNLPPKRPSKTTKQPYHTSYQILLFFSWKQNVT